MAENGFDALVGRLHDTDRHLRERAAVARVDLCADESFSIDTELRLLASLFRQVPDCESRDLLYAFFESWLILYRKTTGASLRVQSPFTDIKIERPETHEEPFRLVGFGKGLYELLSSTNKEPAWAQTLAFEKCLQATRYAPEGPPEWYERAFQIQFRGRPEFDVPAISSLRLSFREPLSLMGSYAIGDIEVGQLYRVHLSSERKTTCRTDYTATPV